MAARSWFRREELRTPAKSRFGRDGDSNLDLTDSRRQPRNIDTRTKKITQQKQASRPAAGRERHPTAPEERLEPGTRPH